VPGPKCGSPLASSIHMNKLEERDWRKLRELVAKETDPHKLPALLEELTEALNARANKFDIHPNAPLHRSETDAGERKTNHDPSGLKARRQPDARQRVSDAALPSSEPERNPH
jgi:hypothetical protein